VPEFAGLLSGADEHKGRPQHQVTLIIAGEERNFSVRVTHEEQGEEDYGSVLTFDDVTELVSAQRTSAWADVARRIAHEIKNPLTPIQLSAERLRRKYGKMITGGRRDLRALHRHHHPPGRRRHAHGRRVLGLRPNPEAADGGSRHPRRRACGGARTGR
jgi:two-component system nitrogen regulation sensor histidine kinase NtrY